jgi:hypothetical protein
MHASDAYKKTHYYNVTQKMYPDTQVSETLKEQHIQKIQVQRAESALRCQKPRKVFMREIIFMDAAIM